MRTQKFARKKNIMVTVNGSLPSSGSSSATVSTTIVTVRTSHGIKNAISDDATFAAVYCVVEIGRLRTNSSDFSLRSFMIP